MKKVIFAWHVHHNVLIELLTEPIENRIKYIKKFKPKNDNGLIELRLKLLKVVKGELPKEFVEARQKYDEDEAWQKCVETWQEYVEVYKKDEPQILALHEKECPNCPWNGKAIFSKEVK